MSCTLLMPPSCRGHLAVLRHWLALRSDSQICFQLVSFACAHLWGLFGDSPRTAHHFTLTLLSDFTLQESSAGRSTPLEAWSAAT